MPNKCRFIIDFDKVLAIDSGAAFGLTDGLLFVAESNPTLSIELHHIRADHLKMLAECGLHPSIKIKSNIDDNIEEKNHDTTEKQSKTGRVSITSL